MLPSFCAKTDYHKGYTNMKMYNRINSVESEGDSSCDESYGELDNLLYHAEKEGRLTTGVFQSAHVLETKPEIVLLCLLPKTKSDNISVRIQHTLIEAYCWENDIRVVSLGAEDFSSIVTSPRSKSTDCNEVDCVLVTSETFVDIPDDEEESDDELTFG